MSPAQRFQAWLNEHPGLIEKVVRAYARDLTEQDELRQEVYFQLWCSVPRFREEAGPTTWIYRVCLNTALTWRRAAGRRERHIDAAAETTGILDQAPTPDRQVEQRDLVEGLYAALRKLPASDRTLLVMLLDGLSYREIAEVTGLTENHVGVALTRARGRLAVQMKGTRNELE